MEHRIKTTAPTALLALYTTMLVITLILLAALTCEARVRCSLCGGEIAGPYLTADDRVYHPQHFLCDYCRRPITTAYQRYGNFRYHKECYTQARAPRCIICGQPITGQHLMDIRGNHMHKEHNGQFAKCSSCQRAIAQGLSYRQYPDGRLSCSICLRSAIDTPEQVLRSETYVRQVLNRYGIAPPQSPITLLPQTQQPGRRGECQITPKNGTKEYLITIIHGLPQTLFEFVLAHELMHQWISDHNPTPRSRSGKQYDEGSCQLAAYFMLSESKDPDAYYYWIAMERSNDYDYGQGYHIAKEYAERNGIQAWLHSLATPGYKEQAYLPPSQETQGPTPTAQETQPSPMYPPENTPYTNAQTPHLSQLMGSALHLLPIFITIAVLAGYGWSRNMYKRATTDEKKNPPTHP